MTLLRKTILLCVAIQAAACTKEIIKEKEVIKEVAPRVCDVRGIFAGTWTNHLGNLGPMVYNLKDDNFTTTSAQLDGNPTGWGSYRNTCDSLILRSYNSINSSYYYFGGKFTDTTRTKVTGIYKNLTTTSETGTWEMTRK